MVDLIGLDSQEYNLYMAKPSYFIELRRGKLRYYYVIKAINGEIVVVSQRYFSKYNAERAATRSATLFRIKFKDR